MPCGSTAQESRLLVTSTTVAAASGVPQPQAALGRFHVAHAYREVAASESAVATHCVDVAMEDQQCEEFHSSVGILDSLPWCRDGRDREPSMDRANSAAAFQTILELAEDDREAAADAEAAGELGDTLTAQAAKAISQMRISASSANLTSHRQDAADGSRCCCCEPPAPPPQQREAAVDKTADAASHLEPPWSHNSCCPGSGQRPASPASLHQLAACHRSERLGATAVSRSASFRRRPASAAQHHHHHHHHPHLQHHHLPQQHQCVSEDCCVPPSEGRSGFPNYQEYLDQLNDRVQLWMLGAADQPNAMALGGCRDGPDCDSFCCCCCSCCSDAEGVTQLQ